MRSGIAIIEAKGDEHGIARIEPPYAMTWQFAHSDVVRGGMSWSDIHVGDTLRVLFEEEDGEPVALCKWTNG